MGLWRPDQPLALPSLQGRGWGWVASVSEHFSQSIERKAEASSLAFLTHP